MLKILKICDVFVTTLIGDENDFKISIEYSSFHENLHNKNVPLYSNYVSYAIYNKIIWTNWKKLDIFGDCKKKSCMQYVTTKCISQLVINK